MTRVPAALLPLAGAALGWLGARMLTLADPWLGSGLAALVVLLFWSAVNGARGENGVASRIGVVTLIFLLLIRWQAMTRLPSMPVYELMAALALARGAMVGIAYTTRPSDGLADRWTLPSTVCAAVLALGAAFGGETRLALVLVAAVVFAAMLLRNWFSTRQGGVDAAGLEAACFAMETWLIVLSGCRNCPWWS